MIVVVQYVNSLSWVYPNATLVDTPQHPSRQLQRMQLQLARFSIHATRQKQMDDRLVLLTSH